MDQAIPAALTFMTSSHLQQQFEAICTPFEPGTPNRALREQVIAVTEAMLAGWRPRLEPLRVLPAAACRAGYWLSLTATFAKDTAAAKDLRRQADTLRSSCQQWHGCTLRFYPPTPGRETPSHDELAREWQLCQGVHPLELRQALTRRRRAAVVLANRPHERLHALMPGSEAD